MLIEFRLDLLKLLLGILSVLRLERLNDFQRLLFQFETDKLCATLRPVRSSRSKACSRWWSPRMDRPWIYGVLRSRRYVAC